MDGPCEECVDCEGFPCARFWWSRQAGVTDIVRMESRMWTHWLSKRFVSSSRHLHGFWLVFPKYLFKRKLSAAEMLSSLEWSRMLLVEPGAVLYLLGDARCERPPVRFCLFKWQMSQTSGATRDPINWWSCNKLRLSNILMALSTTCPRT